MFVKDKTNANDLQTKGIDSFWEMYSCLSPEERTFYEVIREGIPTKLYFDLGMCLLHSFSLSEFSKEANPDSYGDTLVDLFISFLCEQLKEVFDIAVTEQDIVRLDSTSDMYGTVWMRVLILLGNIPNI